MCSRRKLETLWHRNLVTSIIAAIGEDENAFIAGEDWDVPDQLRCRVIGSTKAALNAWSLSQGGLPLGTRQELLSGRRCGGLSWAAQPALQKWVTKTLVKPPDPLSSLLSHLVLPELCLIPSGGWRSSSDQIRINWPVGELGASLYAAETPGRNVSPIGMHAGRLDIFGAVQGSFPSHPECRTVHQSSV